MPSKHVEKLYAEDTFYHVFNRGVEKRNIFLDESDYVYFISLFNRYLGSSEKFDTSHRLIPNYSKSLELVAYCLMPNHFHLLVYQKDKDSMQIFMRSVCTAYSMYFNKKYERVGTLFQDRYKAVLIDDDSYFTHISRYIHLNPLDVGEDYLAYPYSSLSYWVGSAENRPEWLKPDRVIGEFSSPQEYLDFLSDYKEVKAELKQIKKSLKE